MKPRYWDDFAAAVVDCTLEWGDRQLRCPEAQTAWTEIVMFIVRLLKDGFYDEMRKLRRDSMKRPTQTQINGPS